VSAGAAREGAMSVKASWEVHSRDDRNRQLDPNGYNDRCRTSDAVGALLVVVVVEVNTKMRGRAVEPSYLFFKSMSEAPANMLLASRRTA
jgi:hypothetical protein